MKRKFLLVLLLLAGGLALGGWRLWAATSDSHPPKVLKPVVVVSVSGYDKLMDNVATLGKVSGNPEFAGELNTILKLIAIQQEIGGPDRARPWGAVLQIDGDELTGCAFIPSSNLSTLATMVEPFVGKAEEFSRGIYKVRSYLKPVYVTQRDGWAFFAYSPEALDAVPADPMALLAGLNTQYDVAVRVHAPNILPKHREKIVEWLKGQVEPYTEQQPNEPTRVYTLRKQVTDEVLRPALAAVNDAETFTVGWALDNAAQKTYVDVGMTVKAETETARSIADIVDVKSQFSGFRLPNAALVGNWAGQIPPQKAESLSSIIETVRAYALDDIDQKNAPDAKAQVAKQLVGSLADLLQANVKSGRVDGGMAVVAKPDALTVLAGGHVVDSAKLTAAIKVLAAAAVVQNPGAAEWFKFDADECRSVQLHTLSIPIPADAKNREKREKVVALIGEKFDMVIGIGPQSAFVAVGREPMTAIKQVIEQSAADGEKTVSPVEFSLALGETAKFIAATGKPENRSMAALVAMALEPSAGRDHIKLIAGPIPQGVQYRFEVEEGVLKLLSRLGTIAMGEEEPKK